MSQIKERLKDMDEAIITCNKCGFCLEKCPVYLHTKSEGEAARGRIYLLRQVLEGKLHIQNDPELMEIINSCILCLNCVDSCPSGVITDKIIKSARSEAFLEKGLPLFKKVAVKSFSDNKKLNLGTKALKLYQRTGLQSLMRKSKALSLFGRIGEAEGFLPEMPDTSLKKDAAKLLEKRIPDARGEVIFFAGCIPMYVYTSVGLATIKVLQALKYQVVMPDFKCCGVPHMGSGDLKEAQSMAKANIDLLESMGDKDIVTSCATCASGLIEYPDLFSEQDPYYKRASSIVDRVKEVSQFLSKEEIEGLQPVNKRVTYHDSCHLVRGLGVAQEPRDLLKKIPGLTFVEMKEANQCCGGGGTYNITHPELSLKILNAKMTNVKDTGAQILATSCPGCTVQLNYGLKEYGLKDKVEVMHPVEILQKSLRAT